jgi:hypothetical protein
MGDEVEVDRADDGEVRGGHDGEETRWLVPRRGALGDPNVRRWGTSHLRVKP